VALGFGQNRADLDQRFFRSARHCGTTEGADHPCASNKRNDLITREHERRQFEAVAHQVTNTCFPVDRHTRRLWICDVAINGPVRYLETLREHPRRHQTASTQLLYDLKKTVCTPHLNCSLAI